MAKVFQVDTGGTLTTNLVSYWKLEDVNDFWASNNLTNNNSVEFNAGKVNNAADGGSANSTKYLVTTADLGISGATQNVSIAFWFNITTAPTSGQEQDFFWMGKNAATTQFFRGWYVNEAGTLKVTFYRRGDSDDRADYSADMGTGTWHFYVGTYDATNIKIYVDNTLRATTASDASGTGDFTGMSMMADRTGGSYVKGLVDEWGVWTKVLSSTEMTDLYNGGAGQTMVLSDADEGIFSRNPASIQQLKYYKTDIITI